MSSSARLWGASMLKDIRISLILLPVFAVVLGIGYPLAIEWSAQKAFPHQANGSLISDANGQVVGSGLIAQAFVADKYFHPRPSAAGQGYDAANSSGANAIVSSKDFVKTVRERADALHVYGNAVAIPVDLVTSSASGLDPDISVDAALYQAVRVAEVRGIPTIVVEEVVHRNIIKPVWGLLGTSHVNVLHLNIALDHIPAVGTP